VYLSYRSQLKAYSKQQFDPFRRRDRITFFYEKDKCIETTIGQLNFFRWVIQNDILLHIQENLAEIEGDMITVQKKTSEPLDKLDIAPATVVSSQKKGKKRIELSKSFVKNMNKFDGARTIAFS
jgi:hypothetical protein